MSLNPFFFIGMIFTIATVVFSLVTIVFFILYKKKLKRDLDFDYGDWRDVNAK